MGVEREAKLLAPTSFELPDLDRLLPGVVAAVARERELDAVYFDSADLALARAGATLRRRTGEGDEPRWTLKLPDEAADGILSRHELEAAGSTDTPPESLRDLARGYLHGRPVAAIARLCTERTSVGLRDHAGEPLAEVVDDRVSAFRDGLPIGSFREVEVERLTDRPLGAKVVHAAVDRLVGAGCAPDTPMPKLVRALNAATRYAADADPLPGRSPDLATVVRYTLGKSVRRLIRHDAGVRLGSAPDVHQFRVATRRLRSDLRAFEAVLDPGWAHRLRTELGWLGEVVGAVRDNDVLSLRLREHVRELPECDAEAGAELLDRLADQGDAARRELLTALRSDRYDMLVEELEEATRHPVFAEGKTKANAAAGPVVRTMVRRRWRRLRKGVEELPQPPTDSGLHHVRILAKRLRYTAEIGLPLFGKDAAELAGAASEVQTLLGDQHDAIVAEEWLRSAASDLPSAAIAAGELIARQRHLAAQLRARWPMVWHAASARPLREWLR